MHEIKIGDWLYIQNTKDYFNKNPNGRFSGEHLICVGKKQNEPIFAGFLNKYVEMNYQGWKKLLLESNNSLQDIQGLYENNNKIIVKRINIHV